MARLHILKSGNANDTDIVRNIAVASANGAITIENSTVFITKGTAAAMTLAAPTATTHDGVRIEIVATTAAAHTVTVATAGFNDLGAAGDVATFGGAKGDGLTVVAYQGDWYVLHRTNITLA